MVKNVLVVCGTGIATSTVVAEKLKELAKENGIAVNFKQTKVTEAKSELKNNTYDLVISTTQFPYETEVPLINGLPFISGLGQDKLVDEIISRLKD